MSALWRFHSATVSVIKTADRLLSRHAECRHREFIRRGTAVINSNSRQRPRGKSRTAFAKFLGSRAQPNHSSKNATAHSPKNPTFHVERGIPWEVFKTARKPDFRGHNRQETPSFRQEYRTSRFREQVNLSLTLHSIKSGFDLAERIGGKNMANRQMEPVRRTRPATQASREST